MDDANGDKTSSFGSSSVSCSICLDLVTHNGDRSTAKLHCGHEFHLDCIGSAFNMKGAMQCPNCRKVEGGRWLYANGSARSYPESSVDGWTPNEDPYEFSYSETPFGVHWCPFSGLTGVHSSFMEVESPSTTFHDLHGNHAIFAEQTAPSSFAHSYVAYFRPIPPTSSNSSENIDDPNLSHRWNGQSGHNEIYTRAFPAINVQYHSLGRHPRPFSANSSLINGVDQASLPPATLRSARIESEAMARSGSFVHPFPYGHGSVPRGGSSFVSSTVHLGSNARSNESIQASQANQHQQPPRNPTSMPSSIIPGVRRFNGPRGLPRIVPAVPQSDHSRGFYIFPPSGSSDRNLHGPENPLLTHVHTWEGDRLSHYPVLSVDRDSGWGSFHHAAGGSDSSNRSVSFWQRHWS